MTRFPAILLLIVIALPLHAADHIVWYPKAQTFDLEVRNMPVEKFLGMVKMETGWEVMMEPGVNRVVGGKFRNKPAAKAMSLLLGRTRFALLPRADGGTQLKVYSGSARMATQQVGEVLPEALPEAFQESLDDIPDVYDGQLLTLRVKVHYLKSPFPAINADPELTNIRSLIADANEVWRPAGIRFSMMGNPKSMRPTYHDAEKTFADLFRHDVTANEARQFILNGVTLRRLLPDLPDRGKTIHIVIIHTLPPTYATGLWMPQKGMVILSQVLYADLITKGSGWINEENKWSPFLFTRKNTLAHEFGHALSLPHVAIKGNLMGGRANARDPGYRTASDLNADQIAAARKQAFTGGPFVPGFNPKPEN